MFDERGSCITELLQIRRAIIRSERYREQLGTATGNDRRGMFVFRRRGGELPFFGATMSDYI